MKNRNLSLALLSGFAAITLVAFQNCSKGYRASSLSSTSGDGSSEIGIPGGPGASSCLFDSSENYSITGLEGALDAKTGYSLVTRQAGSSFLSPSTSMTMMHLSDCYKLEDFKRGGKCQATPACTPHSSTMVSITLKCSSTSDTTQTCANYASTLGQEVNISDVYAAGNVLLSVTQNSNVCDTTGASSKSYLLPLDSQSGTMKVSGSLNLAEGGRAEVTFFNVSLLHNGTDTGDQIALNGTFAGEIVVPVACTP